MAKTGKVAKIRIDEGKAHGPRPQHAGLRWRLLSGLSAFAFVAAVSLPVTVDTASLTPELAAAQAAGNGNGNGNGDGQGKGKGNGKGRGDENGIGRKPPKDYDGDDDDQGDDDDDHGDDDDGGRPGRASEDRPDGGGGGAGEFGDADEASLADAVAEAGHPADNGIGNPAAAALPTVRQIFSLGENSVLSGEQELLAIKNGWTVQD